MDDTQRMEYIGPAYGAISYTGTDDNRRYRGGRHPDDRYADVLNEDVAKLAATGHWQTVEVQSDGAAVSAPDTVSTDDAAATLGLADTATVRELIDAGELEATKDGNRYAVSTASLQAYQERRLHTSNTPTTQQIADAEQQLQEAEAARIEHNLSNQAAAIAAQAAATNTEVAVPIEGEPQAAEPARKRR